MWQQNQQNIGKRTVIIGEGIRRTCSDLDFAIDDNDKSKRVIIGHSTVREGVIIYTASKNWIARNKRNALVWQKENGFA